MTDATAKTTTLAELAAMTSLPMRVLYLRAVARGIIEADPFVTLGEQEIPDQYLDVLSKPLPPDAKLPPPSAEEQAAISAALAAAPQVDANEEAALNPLYVVGLGTKEDDALWDARTGLPSPSAIARLVRSRRGACGWTQGELATRAHTAQATISRIELGGSVSRQVMTRVAAALGCELPVTGLRNEPGYRAQEKSMAQEDNKVRGSVVHLPAPAGLAPSAPSYATATDEQLAIRKVQLLSQLKSVAKELIKNHGFDVLSIKATEQGIEIEPRNKKINLGFDD